MNCRWYRIAGLAFLILISSALIAQPPTENPDPGGGGSGGSGCETCYRTVRETANSVRISIWCGLPQNGTYGATECEVSCGDGPAAPEGAQACNCDERGFMCYYIEVY